MIIEKLLGVAYQWYQLPPSTLTPVVGLYKLLNCFLTQLSSIVGMSSSCKTFHLISGAGWRPQSLLNPEVKKVYSTLIFSVLSHQDPFTIQQQAHTASSFLFIPCVLTELLLVQAVSACGRELELAYLKGLFWLNLLPWFVAQPPLPDSIPYRF